MKNFLHSRDGAAKGAALMIVLAFVVLLAGVALAYFSRTTTDRQLAQSSYNDTSADLLARTALDIVVNDFKQEILSHPTVTPAAPFYITPVPYTPPPQVSGSPIANLIRQSFSGDPTGRTSNVNSGTASANGRFISLARWNSHYLIPRANTSNVDNTIDSTPVGLNQSQYSSFTAPNWVLVTPQGPAQAPAPNAVIGRYAFAVYDEGGLLDMSLAGYPSWSSCNTPTPTPTPWLVNVGRKGIMAFADLTALPWPSASPSPSTRIDNIVGWRNYAMTQRTFTGFPTATPGFAGETDCGKQDFYGSYLLYFGDPPFSITSLSDKLLASTYPFTAASNYMYPAPASGVNSRTDQSLMTRQELLRLLLSLGSSSTGYNQNVLQYMGTFSRERNRPAPDWSPDLQGGLSEGRFNMNNLALVIPNPAQCIIAHGKKTGWRTGKNKNKLCGDSEDVHQLFGLFFVTAKTLDDLGHTTSLHEPGYWVYIGNNDPLPGATATPAPQIGCLKGANLQNDFFQILNFALSPVASRQKCAATLAKTFAVGASLIDQYDSGASCVDQKWAQPVPDQQAGCDLDKGVAGPQWATHTTVIKYKGGGSEKYASGMEKDWVTGDGITGGDLRFDDNNGSFPHRPCGGSKGGLCHSAQTPAPTPRSGGVNATVVMNHAFSNVGEFGYGMNTSDPANPTGTLDFSSPSFPDAAVLDFFSYNPISSAYPRAGIVNLYTRNAPVLAAMLSSTWRTEADSANPNPAASPAGRVSPSQAMDAANRIVQETQNLLAGTPGYGPVTPTDLTRAIAARLVAAGAAAPSWSSFKPEEKESIARALAEMGQTRTWNLFIDVIAQTGKYAPDATDVTQANKFVVEGEKRYWLHVALGRDLIQGDGLPCGTTPGAPCQVDVLGTQLEEVIE